MLQPHRYLIGDERSFLEWPVSATGAATGRWLL
jgi:hypothetical protein